MTRQCTALWGKPDWALCVHKLLRQIATINKQQVTVTKDGSAHNEYLAATLAPWIHDTLCPLCLLARAICTLLTCFSQTLWCVSLPWRDSLYPVAAHTSNLHPIAVLQPAPLKCVMKVQRINRTIVVVTRIPDFTLYVIDGGQDCTFTVVSFNIMIIWSAPQEILKHSQAAAISARATRWAWCGQVQINLVSGTPEAKMTYVWPMCTVKRYTIAPSTRQPINVGLAQARPNKPTVQLYYGSIIVEV